MSNTQQAFEGSSMRSALAQGRAFAHIAKFHPELTSFRRDLHANPELGFEEIYTSARVIEALKVCGVDSVHTTLVKQGVVALVHGPGRSAQNPGRMIGLRADMDALLCPSTTKPFGVHKSLVSCMLAVTMAIRPCCWALHVTWQKRASLMARQF
jgi:hypothetical protein